MSELVNKIIRNERVSSEDALDIIQNFSTLEIGQLATLRKKIIDPSNKVSFVITTFFSSTGKYDIFFIKAISCE